VSLLGLAAAKAVWTTKPPPPVSLAQRLQAFPTRSLPIRQPVQLRWNAQHVPFIEAADDRDLAVALGAVHAHLRLTQIELMRRIAQGRLAQVFGPAARDIDHALRLLDVGRAVPAIAAMLPGTTSAWLSGFADGLNAVIAHGGARPHDLEILGIEPEPWTVPDLLCLSRLVAADFSWRVWLRLLRLRGRSDWGQIWRRLVGADGATPSAAGDSGGDLALLLAASGRGGSNALAVAPWRSASGAPLIAGDPHLPILLPTTWLIAGYKSPGHHAVGLMIPGVPAIAVGRNPWIAWAGTNLHAASSDLIDVGDLAPPSISTRRESIAMRWSRPHAVELRDSPCGPIISDAPLFGLPRQRPVALRWVGHRATDELSALLAVGRARSWAQFRAALDGFAIPGQNLIYADVEGHIGQVMAAHLPSRPPAPPADLVQDRSALGHWDRMVTGSDLPSRLDPPEGFVASANDAPPQGRVAVGYFFSPDIRVKRLRARLGAASDLTRDHLVALHNDVVAPAAAALAAALLRRIDGPAANVPVVDALRAWDGAYTVESPGALAFELILYHFVRALHGRKNLAVYRATWDAWSLVRDDLARTDPDRLRRAARSAVQRAQPPFARWRRWGDAHRLRLMHVFGAAPLLGGRFRFTDLPADGGNETLLKTAHGFAAGRHAVQYGSNARHICDLADLDANHFVLLGGQDGWLGSATFLDQLALWRERAMIQMPLRPETVRSLFSHVMTLAPAEPTMDP
jgi:penicillin amidase